MSNIPSFSDVCGTVVESLAETIQNREKIIIQLREDNARLERVAADAVRKATAWKNEVDTWENNEKKIHDLQEEVRNLSERNAALQRVIERQNVRIAAISASCCNTPSDSDPQTGVQYGDLT
jgi:predicted RNase H-like nuclease (RuvC/YqgF family)